MNNDINTGGPAFPSKLTGPCEAYGWKADAGQALEFSGMTLRDYFAAKAMQGFFSDNHVLASVSSGPAGRAGELANAAYEMADAMIKARNA